MDYGFQGFSLGPLILVRDTFEARTALWSPDGLTRRLSGRP